MSLPADLPAPEDDGAADHLPGTPMPQIVLPSTAGGEVALDQLGAGRTVLDLYPMTGRPGVDLPDGWNEIPGAWMYTRGLRLPRPLRRPPRRLRRAVYGLSSQSTAYQAEVAERLDLPFEVLADTGHDSRKLSSCRRSPPEVSGGSTSG